MAKNNNFRVVKGNGTGKQPDPQKTLDVKNEKLVDAIDRFKEDKKVLPEIMTLLTETRVLVPVSMHKVNNIVFQRPAIFQNKEGDRFLWAFTDKESIKEQPQSNGLANMTFTDLAKLAMDEKNNVKAVSINPQSAGIVLGKPVLQALAEGKLKLNPLTNGKPLDPQMTLEVKNEEFETALEAYKTAKSGEALITLAKAAATSRVLVPTVPKEVDGKKTLVHTLVVDKDGKKLLPVFTSKQYVPQEVKGIMNLPFTDALKTGAREAANSEEFNGIVINPNTVGIRFAPKFLTAWAETPDDPETALKKAAPAQPQVRQVKMTEKQYLLFEHIQFENAFFPATLFTEGQEFIDNLCTRKEEYVDELFEESYKEKRMYPYLPEDFSVMALGIAEDMDIVRVDFPSQDQGVGACSRAYLTWNSKTQSSHYFGIVLAQGKQQNLIEITADGKRKDCGECPTEGMELNTILELVRSDEEEE